MPSCHLGSITLAASHAFRLSQRLRLLITSRPMVLSSPEIDCVAQEDKENLRSKLEESKQQLQGNEQMIRWLNNQVTPYNP